MYNLGYLYGEQEDYTEAKKYYKMAADLGNEKALENYNRLSKIFK